jgi:hypothetical protein
MQAEEQAKFDLRGKLIVGNIRSNTALRLNRAVGRPSTVPTWRQTGRE